VRFLSHDWCRLAWTPWAPFKVQHPLFSLLPLGPGVYRVRPVGQSRLVYIGQTGRSVRGRLGDLCRTTLRNPLIMPFDDPHTAAPSLWALKEAEGMDFECSGAPVAVPKQVREAMECYLLWQYRLESGESTLCNHGRFHPRYLKSGVRKSGVVGRRLHDEDPINPAGGPSAAPLQPQGHPADSAWAGREWSNLRPLTPRNIVSIPPRPGLYKLLAAGCQEALYIGQSRNLRSRLSSHSRKPWRDETVLFSFSALANNTLPHQLRELENDLIGAYYEQTCKAPVFQFLNHK